MPEASLAAVGSPRVLQLPARASRVRARAAPSERRAICLYMSGVADRLDELDSRVSPEQSPEVHELV